MSEYPLKILIGILLAVSFGPIWAHSFDLGFVIPMTGPQSELGQQALDGFMLATTEEDTHADETSDGHLARTIHKHARALACSLIPQGIILNQPDQ